MNSCERARRRVGMTQAEFATLLGVSQASVSGYESGTRRPSGRVKRAYDALLDAISASTVTEDLGRGRSTTYPATRWTPVVDAEITLVDLPVRLDWSPRTANSWRLDDEQHRRSLYSLVLDEGDAVDVQTYIDPDELIEWADELLVARATRPAVNRLRERLLVG